MNNDKSNTRGSEIRRVVIFLLLAGFCVAIFAPSAAARGWDPNGWPFPDRDRSVSAPSGDDGGWNDGQTKSIAPGKRMLGCYDIRITAPTFFLWFFNMMDIPDLPDQGDGNDRRSLDQSRTTPSQ